MRQLPFQYAFRNLGRSRVRLGALLVGSSLVALLILASGGFVRGMQRTLTGGAGLHENVILLGAGSEEGVERSQIDASVEGIAAASIPGLKERAGVVYASPEIHAALPVRESGADEREMLAVMRGVRPVALLVHPEVEIVEGRPPASGRDEMMVGGLAATRLGLPESRLAVGETLRFDDRDWTIVGRFSAPGTVMDAEIWLPLIDLQIGASRESSLSCVVVTLEEATFADVDLFAKGRLDLELSAIRESDYYASIAGFFAPIRAMIVVTAVLIALGGVLGGLNTMYAAFASRVREVGMLQALGFTRRAIALSAHLDPEIGLRGGVRRADRRGARACAARRRRRAVLDGGVRAGDRRAGGVRRRGWRIARGTDRGGSRRGAVSAPADHRVAQGVLTDGVVKEKCMHRIVSGLVVAGLALGLAGCSEEAGAPEATGASWLLASEPEGAVGVVEAKASAAEGDRVVVRGRIGGRAEALYLGSAVFTILDLGVAHCGENPEDGCATPWDYCCETPDSIAANGATVQVAGVESGSLGGLSPLDEVVIVGTVGPRPTPQVLTITATGVHRVGG